MSNFYFDVLKDRLYTSAPQSKTRRAAQTVLYKVLDALTLVLTPILHLLLMKFGSQCLMIRAETVNRRSLMKFLSLIL